jgi:hypothetical protein
MEIDSSIHPLLFCLPCLQHTIFSSQHPLILSRHSYAQPDAAESFIILEGHALSRLYWIGFSTASQDRNPIMTHFSGQWKKQ